MMLFYNIKYYFYILIDYLKYKKIFLRLSKKIYYHFLSIDNIYLKFLKIEWEKLEINEREVIIQEIENREAKSLKRKKVRIRLVKRIDDSIYEITLGKYNYRKNIIFLADIDNPFIILKTYFYEQKYATNYFITKKLITRTVFEKCLSLLQFDTVANMDNKRRQFILQKVELDANFYAIDRILKFKRFYQDDDNWISLLEDNNKYIEMIVELEKQNTKTIKELIIANINKAYEIELISANEYKKLVKKLKNIDLTISLLYNHIINLNYLLMDEFNRVKEEKIIEG